MVNFPILILCQNLPLKSQPNVGKYAILWIRIKDKIIYTKYTIRGFTCIHSIFSIVINLKLLLAKICLVFSTPFNSPTCRLCCLGHLTNTTGIQSAGQCANENSSQANENSSEAKCQTKNRQLKKDSIFSAWVK